MKAGGNLFPNREGMDDFPHWEKDLICQEKADGWFASAVRQSKGTRLFSASSRELKNPQLDQTREALDEVLPLGTIVVGELGFGTAAETRIAEKNGFHRFLPFDIVQLKSTPTGSLPYWERFAHIAQLIRKGKREEVQEILTMRLHAMSVAKKIDRVLEMYESIKNSDGEGLMLKTADHPYVFPGVTDQVFKIKKLVTKDYVLMGYTPSDAPTFKKQGMNVGAMVCGLYRDGKLTEVTQTSGFPFELRKEFSENPKKYIGRVVELGGYQVFASGAMRHSSFQRFREDRDPEDCT
jgi:ATP-dependent DNA ligase